MSLNLGSLWENAIPDPAVVASWLPRARRIRRVLLLGDVHANWLALVGVLKHAGQMGYDTTCFLGDMVGYGPRPVECVSLLRDGLSRRGRWLAGNHDLGIVDRLCEAPGPKPKMTGAAMEALQMNQEELMTRPDLWDWLQSEVTVRRVWTRQRRYGAKIALYVHADPTSPVDFYLRPADSLNIANRLRRRGHSTVLVTGHTHMVCLAHLAPGAQRTRLLGIRYGQTIPLTTGAHLINPGSVGQPRDGDTRASYAILDVRNWTITYHRVPYDVNAVQTELAEKHYPGVLIERLGTAVVNDTCEFSLVYRLLPDGAGVEPISSTLDTPQELCGRGS